MWAFRFCVIGEHAINTGTLKVPTWAFYSAASGRIADDHCANKVNLQAGRRMAHCRPYGAHLLETQRCFKNAMSEIAFPHNRAHGQTGTM